MDDAHMHGPSPPTSNGTAATTMQKHHSLMHMTFFWGTDSLILFSGWPGTRPGMYALALVFVFVLSVLVEWLSHCNLLRDGSKDVGAGLVQTLMHTIRVGLANLLMLALMSFNVGVFIVVLAGHMLGFLFFRSRVFKKSSHSGKTTDLPPMSC
ncbi:copper transporter 1-like [Cornus florida]|uniref:copper transporter 1-like n=1 Tax=Cornus florida TaxID=4283 RepID=UPI0028A1958A|nr:copper transporter 1-like [Cornus florida]